MLKTGYRDQRQDENRLRMMWTYQRKIPILLSAMIMVIYGTAFYFRQLSLLLVATGMFLIAVSLQFQRLASIGIFAATLCISLAAAEVVAPLFFTTEKKEWEYVSTHPSAVWWKRSDDLGSLGSAGVYTVKAESLSGETIFDVKYSIGEDGFRVTPLAQNGYRRINFLGDSLTFGAGLNDNETLPYFINQKMKNISVKNFGFPAYGPQQALAIMESERNTKGTINFFLTAPWHAVRSSCKPKFTEGSTKYEIASNDGVVKSGRCWDESRMLYRVLKHSRLYQVAENIWINSVSDGDFELYLAIVRQIAEISHRRDQDFIIGFIKADNNFFTGTSYTNEKVFVKLREISDEIIDVTLAERSESVDEIYFIHRLDKHPSARANADRATKLVETFDRHL